MDDRLILTGQGFQVQDAMVLGPVGDPLEETYLDPGHRGEEYNECVLRSVLMSGNAQNAELNKVKSSFNDMSLRMQQLELNQHCVVLCLVLLYTVLCCAVLSTGLYCAQCCVVLYSVLCYGAAGGRGGGAGGQF